MRTPTRRPVVLAALLAATAACAWWMVAADAPDTAPEPPAFDVVPGYVRCDLDPGASRDIDVTITARRAVTLLAADAGCRCVALRDALPLAIAAGATAHLTLRAVGIAPGIKTIGWRTTAGAAETHVQVATQGLGGGDDALEAAMRIARSRGCALWLLVHDLRGEARNCGCSVGALGGADRLAALPARVRERDASLRCRFVLSGDVDGDDARVGAALRAHGWESDPAAIRVTADPLPALAAAGVVAVVATAPVALQHRRLVRPILDRGAVAIALIVDEHGELQDQVPIPIDRTLPSDAETVAALAAPATTRIAEPADLGARCRTCHASAYDAWAASRHARAWASLAAADRTDACIGCHSTRRGDVAVPQVHCQACHEGADRHADAPTAARCASVDCRACHDQRLDPAFDRAACWQRIVHGR